MYAVCVLLTISLCIVYSRAENPAYDQGVYKPDFLNYCYEDREECREVCGCMLDRKCMVRPIASAVMTTILERHNGVRKERLKLDPKASGMPKLDYDAQLEAISQCWAAKCRKDTTDCLLTESYSEIGMNVGMIKIEEMNTSPFLESPYSDTKPLEELWKTVIETWVKEIDKVQLQQEWAATEQSESQRGAQMIHDQTLAIGCSWSASPEGTFFFCAYGPGLKNGSLVYKIGPSCTSCPPGLKCADDTDGLCVRYSLYPSPEITYPPPAKEKVIKKTPPKAPSFKSTAVGIKSSTEYLILIPFAAFIWL